MYRCGERLVAEVEGLRREYKGLERITFVGHSMVCCKPYHCFEHLPLNKFLTYVETETCIKGIVL